MQWVIPDDKRIGKTYLSFHCVSLQGLHWLKWDKGFTFSYLKLPVKDFCCNVGDIITWTDTTCMKVSRFWHEGPSLVCLFFTFYISVITTAIWSLSKWDAREGKKASSTRRVFSLISGRVHTLLWTQFGLQVQLRLCSHQRSHSSPQLLLAKAYSASLHSGWEQQPNYKAKDLHLDK